jgi:hypothetical protein
MSNVLPHLLLGIPIVLATAVLERRRYDFQALNGDASGKKRCAHDLAAAQKRAYLEMPSLASFQDPS